MREETTLHDVSRVRTSPGARSTLTGVFVILGSLTGAAIGLAAGLVLSALLHVGLEIGDRSAGLLVLPAIVTVPTTAACFGYMVLRMFRRAWPDL